MQGRFGWGWFAVGLAWSAVGWSMAAAADGSTRPAVEFQRDVRPILSDTCFACHGPDVEQRATDLRLDSREGAFIDLGGYQAIVPGKPGESELYRRISEKDPDERMPPPEADRHLSREQIELLRRWIEEGADWQQQWSFVPPKHPPLPEVQEASWPRDGIDYFILARLEREGLRHSPEADKTTLIRRVTLDLTGLPPTPEEVDAFVADRSPRAYEKLVDRLLASPRYGERMAVAWLDAARYADTNGYHIDNQRTMWRWRDWVIGAFNRNLPFDQFTIEQLAGDLLPNPTLEEQIATGFNRNHGITFEGGIIPEEYRVAYVVDRVNTTGTVWLGLSIGCAQCHDHKYDPITQKEYYGLFAFFNNLPEKGSDGRAGNSAPLVKAPTPDEQSEQADLQRRIVELQRALDARRPALAAAEAAWEATMQPRGEEDARPAGPEAIQAILATAPENRTAKQQAQLRDYYLAHHAPAELRKLHGEMDTMRKQEAKFVDQIPDTMVMREMDQPRETFVLARGRYDKPGEPVTAGVPAALPPLPKGAPPNRLGLARWLVDRGNPLTARVAVNRFWQMVFGIGLVKTAEDFGSQGQWPSHPELLDWLATEFVAGGWDVKGLMKLLVTSATYRQSSRVPAELLERDPENRLLARGPRFRLDAEFLRDQALFAGGLLVEKIGGPSVHPYQPEGLWREVAYGEKFTAQVYRQDHGASLYRRGLYTFWKRSCPPPNMRALDAPGREFCTVRRPRTNTPLQSLVLLNDPVFVEAARKLAERAMSEAGPGADARAAYAFRLATARKPRAAETAMLLGLFEAQRARYAKDHDAATKLLSVGESPWDKSLDPAELAAWTTVANVILSLDETVTKN